MFNVGPGELIVVALVLLIAVGPEQLPGLIRRAGVAMGQAKSMTDGLRSEFMSGIDEIERATDPSAWAASAGPSNVRPKPAKPAEPKDDAESKAAESNDAESEETGSEDTESNDPGPEDAALEHVSEEAAAEDTDTDTDTDAEGIATVADAANAGVADTVAEEAVAEVVDDELGPNDPELGETA